ncbi:CDP-alcohol phosphatidyltransferase family protein [Acidobacteriota bacterium]
MIGNYIGWFFGTIRGWLARRLGGLGIHPNLLTTIGFLLNIVTGFLLALGKFGAAGGMMIFAGAFDVIDGAVARMTGRQSRFGAFYDSVMDRYSDMALYVGIIVFYVRTDNMLGILLTCIALSGTIMVSYCRARAENIIPQCKVGFWERPERIVLLIIGTLSGHILSTMAILAVFTHLTVIRRILYTLNQSREEKRTEP